ncbi:hypothetical protein SCHPADRAFT_904809 [Schizopora paradoxa]|uniref:Fungal calcium binding protein domain-containing protein n=1 Tax=Schizopora paradoxa TaxID=27342 RepID=A0A0H2RLI5_9AGAM|nr:hypothetical protein SCHPADRAFT_904809 [Schizopora paradoxa]
MLVLKVAASILVLANLSATLVIPGGSKDVTRRQTDSIADVDTDGADSNAVLSSAGRLGLDPEECDDAQPILCSAATK